MLVEYSSMSGVTIATSNVSQMGICLVTKTAFTFGMHMGYRLTNACDFEERLLFPAQ